MITKRASSSLPGQWMKDQLYLASLGHMLALRAGWGLAGRPGRVDGAGTEVWKGPRYEPSMHWPLPVLLGSVHQPQPGWSRQWPHVLYPEQFSAADRSQNKQCRIFITVTYGIIIVDVFFHKNREAFRQTIRTVDKSKTKLIDRTFCLKGNFNILGYMFIPHSFHALNEKINTTLIYVRTVRSWSQEAISLA